MTVPSHPAAPRTATTRPWLIAAALIVALMLPAAPLAGQTTQPAPLPTRPSVLAYGSADQYWIAEVQSFGGGSKPRYKTLVRQQTLPAGDWKDLGTVFGQAVALAEAQGELAILLDDGSWKRLGEGGLSTGPSVPGSGQILAWGSVASALYAIRAVEGGTQGVTTRPVESATTTRPQPSTQIIVAPPAKPATRPLTLALLRYERGQWVGVADIPAAASTAGSFSLAGAGNKPLLAVSTDGSVINTFALVDGRWEDWGQVRPTPRAANFGVLTAGHLAALWSADAQGGMQLFLKREGEPWSAPKPLQIPPSQAGAQRAFAAAGDTFRMVFLKDGKLAEQRYDATGALNGSLSEMQVPQTNRPDPIVRILYSVMLLGMVVVMLVTFYRRRAVIEKKDEE
ncbi:MAG: hypothetical protein JWN40_4045 [Phycisphaerales bacterium]|nr:hypothetical protein [Phycisphaerales bacterium]